MNKKIFTAIVICLIVALVAFSYFYNKGNDKSLPDTATETVFQSGDIGQGEKSFAFSVKYPDDNETSFTIHTDKETVGEALVDTGIISGEPGPYGMYVKTVNGVTLDYDINGSYWAFYIDGEYATAGVDKTIIEKDKVYTFIAE